MNALQRIAKICKELGLSFTLKDLDELVRLCEKYNEEVVEERFQRMMETRS